MNPYLTQTMARQQQQDMIQTAAAHNMARGDRTRRRRKLFSLGWTFRRSAPARTSETQLKPQATA